jgi:hypothetical protein
MILHTQREIRWKARDQMEGTTTGFIDQHSAGEWHAGEYMVLTDLSRVNLCLSMISFHDLLP